MEYKYTQNENYEDFASGRVIYHMGGAPTFPVRLTLEMYERCLQYSYKKADITLYDCCCGGAYLLTILGFLKNNTISRLYGSDIDVTSLKLAEDNLGLLTKFGMQKRRSELKGLYEKHGKTSHKEALDSVGRLEKRLTKKLETCVFTQNVFELYDLPFIPDIIITDVPYGNMANWNDNDDKEANQMMEALSEVCGRDTIICVCMDKKQKIQTKLYQRLERQLIGKRKFEIYRKAVYGTLASAREYVMQDRLNKWVQLFLRGDGKNRRLADGLIENNFRFMTLTSLEIEKLTIPKGIPQYLTESNDQEWFVYVVNEMINQIKNGWDLPPLIVHYDRAGYHVMDGRHRIEALRKIGKAETEVVIVCNSEEDYQSFLQSN